MYSEKYNMYLLDQSLSLAFPDKWQAQRRATNQPGTKISLE